MRHNSYSKYLLAGALLCSFAACSDDNVTSLLMSGIQVVSSEQQRTLLPVVMRIIHLLLTNKV